MADIRDLLRAPRTHWRVASDPVWQRARRRRRDPVVAWLLMIMGGASLGLLVAASTITIPASLQALQGTQSAASGVRAFSVCHAGGGTNCVVDGDTFWMDGVKIRIADIDTPETHPPRCASEAALGARATARPQALLNAGPIALEGVERDVDRFGRKLRIVTRGGRSLGDTLVAEGLARPWGGARRPWCDV